MERLMLLFLVTGMFLCPASCSSNYKYHCDWCPRHATASLVPPAAADIEEPGTCGYGGAVDMELPNGGHPAAATADLFRAGAGCGACYQLRCRDRRLCGAGGVKVVVTDAAKEETNRTGFVLTREAFMGMAMARHGMSDQLATMDNVQVEFRRVPCEYRKNLAVRVEEGSRTRQQQLAIRFLYQGGQTDIAAVEIAQGGSAPSSSWRPMARQSKRGVWRTARAPDGPLHLRLVITAGSGGKWLRTALPADWRPGGVYDTGLRLTDVAVRTCSRAGDDDDEDELR